MAAVIASSVGTGMVAPTGRPMQGHLVYGANNSKWYLFYLTGTQTLSLAYSADFATWTTSGTTLTLAAAHASEGRNYGFEYLNLAATDIVYFETGTASGNNRIDGRGRLTLGATAWTVTNAETTGSRTGASVGIACPVPVIDSTNTAWFVSQFAGLATSAGYRKATNADTGTAWTAGVSTPTNILSETNAPTSLGTVPLASGIVLFFGDNALSSAGSFTNVRYVPGAGNAEASVLASNLGTAQNTNDWCAVKVSNTDVHFVCRTGANTYTHARYNGTNWTAVAGASIPTQASVAGAGIFLATDGTDVWLFAVDTSNNIQVIKWTASSNAWDAAWATADAGTAAARTYLTGCQLAVNGSIGLAWTQANGTNFDLVGTLYTPATGPPPAQAVAGGLGATAAAGFAVALATGAAAGPVGAVAAGGALALASGSAAGAGTALGVGRVTGMAPGSALGLAAPAGTGLATGTAPGATVGLAAPTGAGQAVGTAPGSAVGLAAPAGAGIALVRAPGTATASGAIAAPGLGLAVATGAATAGPVGAATGVALVWATGAAIGSGGATAVGVTLVSITGVGAAVGSGGATGAGAALATAAGATMGVAAVAAAGTARTTAPGTAAGAGAARTPGGAATRAPGTATGLAWAAGASGAIAPTLARPASMLLHF